jgi:nucleotide-binding universal stress UspA family protein
MTRVKRILCPIDFSEFSRQALDSAVGLARWHKAKVIALHVFARWPAVDVIPSLQTHPSRPVSLKDVDREALLRYLQAFVKDRPTLDVEIETIVQEAMDVHREILAQAVALKADLIVVGSHGRSGFERFLLGSITEKVLRKAECPVMVVPPSGDAAAGARGPVGRILCPVDFSSSAIAALNYAMLLARDADAKLTALHVLEIPAALYETPGFDVAAFRASAEVAARAKLSDLIPERMRTSGKVDTIVSEGRAARDILRVASEWKSDLIVMGTHGHRAIDRLFGSHTEHVVRSAWCPVMVVRAPATP